MKKNTLLLFVMSLLMTVGTGLSGRAQARSFTPEVLFSLQRISSPQISPDGKHFIYTRSVPNMPANSMESEVCLGVVEGSEPAKVLLSKDIKAHSAKFFDASHIVYISQGALMMCDLSGKSTKLSDFDFKVTDFLFSPDHTRVVVIREIPLKNEATEKNPDLKKISGRIYTDLMYKHWDEWVTSIPKPYLATVDQSGKVSKEVKPILGEDELYEVPQKPFGDVGQLAWSPDGKSLVYSCRKKVGLDYAVSTNTDLYLYDIATGSTRNITEGMMGYDQAPTFSPDGNYLAWTSMERDGYESDLNRLFIMDMKSGEKKFLTKGYERNMDQIAWADDSKSIVFLTNDMGLNNLFRIRLKDAKINPITTYEQDDVTGFALNGNTILYGMQSMRYPTDLYRITLSKQDKYKEAVKKTFENDEKLKDIPNITTEKRWITTTDGKKMLTWVILPPNFDPSKKYPAILYCQGGPQSTISQFWSYRWNLRTFASGGYILVAPNRRGVPGFGVEWNEQISGDYGGQNMKDYLTAIDEVKKEPYVDETRLGATGASYGGFSVYWLAGHHDKRFKAFFAHAGIFNLEAQYLETEEKWFANWDMGGSYWDKSNEIAQRTYATSPHRFVDRWDTPIFICHGEKDFRILASQGMMAFDAAKMRGIPAKMLIFPDESHWILQPQNGLLFYRSFLDWMDQWLKDKK